MKKIKFFLLTILLGISQMIFSQNYIFTFQDIKDIAAEVTSTMCPIMIDSDTRFDRCDAIQDGNRLGIQYTYTAVNYEKSQIEYRLNEIQTKMEDQLLNSVKTNNDIAAFRDQDFVFMYVYYDKYHKFLFNIKITPEKYKYKVY